jgi:large subunit ribosomal protein L7e
MSDYVLIQTRRSVPTQNDVLVPETLLKKRKSQEKARAERTAEQDKQKKVGFPLPCNFQRTM